MRYPKKEDRNHIKRNDGPEFEIGNITHFQIYLNFKYFYCYILLLQIQIFLSHNKN